MSFPATKRHGRTLNAYRSVKEARLKRLHTGCNSMTFCKRQNYGDDEKIRGCPGLEGGRGQDAHGELGGFLG